PPRRGVLSLCAGPSGKLWLGIDRGEIIALESGRPPQVLDQAAGLAGWASESLFEDNDGALWAIYEGTPGWRIENGKVERVQISAPQGWLTSVARDTQANIWLAKGTEA